ncbi:hypothetical protein [Streptomyces sp. NPDC056883]|uniref:hypothetical protein n=1 Tax=Streptomyces sp. NPDC056883 TaxID=3345959 RepID=UPI0036C99363
MNGRLVRLRNGAHEQAGAGPVVWWVEQRHQDSHDPRSTSLYAVHRFRDLDGAKRRFHGSPAQVEQAVASAVVYPIDGREHQVRARPIPPSTSIRSATAPFRLLIHENGRAEEHRFESGPTGEELTAVIAELTARAAGAFTGVSWHTPAG